MSAPDVSAIRARLAGATPGPWDWTPMPRHPGILDVTGVRPDRELGPAEVFVAEVRGNGQADADLIAHAPADLAALLDLVDQQAAVIDNVTALADDWERRGEYGDASLTEGARAIRAALNQDKP